MPMLDVSEVLLDPMFAERLTIIRREEVVGENGRNQLSPTTITPKPVGVVTSESNERIKREDRGQYRDKGIRVHTKFRLRGPSKDASEFQPDIVQWNGNPYVVAQIDDYSQFGAGFTSALCMSMSSIDKAPK